MTPEGTTFHFEHQTGLGVGRLPSALQGVLLQLLALDAAGQPPDCVAEATGASVKRSMVVKEDPSSMSCLTDTNTLY